MNAPKTIFFGCKQKYKWSTYTETDTTVTYENAGATSNGGCLEFRSDFVHFELADDLPSLGAFTEKERAYVDDFRVEQKNIYGYEDPTDQRFSNGPTRVVATEPHYYLRMKKADLEQAIQERLARVW